MPRPISVAFSYLEIMYGYMEGWKSLPPDLQTHCLNMVAENRKILIGHISRLSEHDRDVINHALNCFDAERNALTGN